MESLTQNQLDCQLPAYMQRYVVGESARQVGREDVQPEVALEAQGHYFGVSVRRSPNGARGEGTRGKVTEFSRRSRKRLLEMFARLEHRPEKVSFVTLTYPAHYPDPRRAKGHLVAFLKRLERRYGRFSAVWRIEPQKRGAPHFHVLLFGVPYIPKGTIGNLWEAVIGSRSWTRIEAIRSWRGVISYAAKYVAKVTPDLGGADRARVTSTAVLPRSGNVLLDRFVVDVPDLPESSEGPPPCQAGGFNYVPYSAVTFLDWGRWWGVWHADLLPYAERISVRLPFGRWFYDLKRSARHVWWRVNDARMAGFTLFTENPRDWFSLGTMYCVEAMGIV